ncbi:GNAT family N-acetyltransferase [uncultured Pseudoteredinibacter sp.]|uniref:GNAT family N-acetyltransferase n=1 Tax=uncultured Pseudoteredinibacter sp. TaxID=1641701 RepID=UPI00261A3D75|nr:GNAT family N-acetyltransferase [uncultured Pseudoteredinibacter sp.]
MKFKVPEQIETERLILRQFKDEDWKDLHEYYSSEEATRYTVGRAFSEGESWRIMSAMLGHWILRDYGPYALEEKSSSKVIGTAGFWCPNDWPSPEIKWALAPAYWGKGYASEAARALQKIGKEYLPEISLISLIAKENQASIKLALAVGACFDREIDFRGGKWDIYRHPAT